VGSQQVAAKNGNKYDASVGIAFITLRSIECKELPLAGFSELQIQKQNDCR
jgi:hypothetical protein